MPAQRRAQPGQGRRVFCAVHFTLDAASTVLPSVANSGSFLFSFNRVLLAFAFDLFFSCCFAFDLAFVFFECGLPRPLLCPAGTAGRPPLHGLREHWFLQGRGGNTNGCGHAFASLARQGAGGR